WRGLHHRSRSTPSVTANEKVPAAANDRDSERNQRHRSAPAARFAWEKRLRRDKTVTWAVRATGLLIATYANKDGSHARPGVPLLMADMCLKERAVRNHLAELVRLGYLIKTSNFTPAEQRAGKLATVYQLGLPVPGNRTVDGSEGASEDAEGCIGKGASECTPPDQVSPDHLQSTIPQGKPAGSPQGGDRDDDQDEPWGDEEWTDHLAAEEGPAGFQWPSWQAMKAAEDWAGILE